MINQLRAGTNVLLATLGLMGASSAHATTQIATTARGLFSNVRVMGSPVTLVGPVAAVGGRTSPGYTLNGGVASLGLGNQTGVAAALDLGSGSISTSAAANGTVPADTTSGSASALLNNLAIRLFTSQSGSVNTVFSLTASQVQSQAGVTNNGQLTSLSGQSSFSGLDLVVNGAAVLSLGSNVQTAANFVAYDSGGLRIVLNQQTFSNFDNTRVMITNAIGINFTNYLLDGRSLSGGVVAGQSLAEYVGSDPVPEAATWAQLLAGFAVTGAAARRRGRSRPASARARPHPRMAPVAS